MMDDVAHTNPPPPAGYVLITPQSAVTPAMTAWAKSLEADPTFVQFDTAEEDFSPPTPPMHVLARAEWHPPDPPVGPPVWHKGITLYKRVEVPMFRAEQAHAGARGADMSMKLDAARAAALKSAGFDFVVRYVGLVNNGPGDLDLVELGELTAAGLAVMVVQHARSIGWTQTQGTTDGKNAVSFARRAGYPSGATLWLDFEGAIPSSTIAKGYANAWWGGARAVDGTEDPGIYVGAGVPLDEAALYDDLAFRRYWRSMSQVPNVKTRGYQLLQLYPPNVTVAGVIVDRDVVQSDYLGSLPWWCVGA